MGKKVWILVRCSELYRELRTMLVFHSIFVYQIKFQLTDHGKIVSYFVFPGHTRSVVH